jgi:AcrR family transcriptional regulator
MKDDTKPRENYHLGNVPETMIRTGAALLAEKGIEGFSMREVARRAGIAVSTSSHHFGSARGLLTAIATCAFDRLTLEQTNAMDAETDPVAKVVALAQTYIEMSRHFPGYADAMFRWDMLDQDNAAYSTAASASFNLLTDAVAQAAPASAEPEHIRHVAKSIWAMAHGFVTLSMTEGAEAQERITFAVTTMLAGMR